jgi:hypothetical protein
MVRVRVMLVAQSGPDYGLGTIGTVPMAYENFLKKLAYEHSKCAKIRFQSQHFSMFNDFFSSTYLPK